MKIGITGHTSGIGQSLFNKLKDQNEVFGFSRANGYDIQYTSIRKKIVAETNDCDVFINNAYHPEGQTLLLGDVLDRWENTNKTIIHISSNILSIPEHYIVEYPILVSYRSTKLIGEMLINGYKGTVKVLNVLPDIVNTNFYLGELNLWGLNKEKMRQGLDPDYVAELIIQALNNNQTKLVISSRDLKK